MIYIQKLDCDVCYMTINLLKFLDCTLIMGESYGI